MSGDLKSLVIAAITALNLNFDPSVAEHVTTVNRLTVDHTVESPKTFIGGLPLGMPSGMWPYLSGSEFYPDRYGSMMFLGQLELDIVPWPLDDDSGYRIPTGTLYFFADYLGETPSGKVVHVSKRAYEKGFTLPPVRMVQPAADLVVPNITETVFGKILPEYRGLVDRPSFLKQANALRIRALPQTPWSLQPVIFWRHDVDTTENELFDPRDLTLHWEDCHESLKQISEYLSDKTGYEYHPSFGMINTRDRIPGNFGQLVLGLDRNSQFYATLTPDRDPKAAEAKGRVVIGLGLGPGRGLMVTSLRREVALARQVRDGLTPAAQALIDEVMAKPRDESTIFGVQFRVGEPATGQVVDTSVYDHRAVQATLQKVEAELAGTTLGRRAEALVIGGTDQRAEAAKTVAAMDEMQALQGELEASRAPEAMDDLAADAPSLDALTAAGDETVLGAWIRQVTRLQVDNMRLDSASKDPADDANPDVVTFRQVAREMVETVRALHAAEMEAKGLAANDKAGRPEPPGKKLGG